MPRHSPESTRSATLELMVIIAILIPNTFHIRMAMLVPVWYRIASVPKLNGLFVNWIATELDDSGPNDRQLVYPIFPFGFQFGSILLAKRKNQSLVIAYCFSLNPLDFRVEVRF